MSKSALDEIRDVAAEFPDYASLIGVLPLDSKDERAEFLPTSRVAFTVLHLGGLREYGIGPSKRAEDGSRTAERAILVSTVTALYHADSGMVYVGCPEKPKNEWADPERPEYEIFYEYEDPRTRNINWTTEIKNLPPPRRMYADKQGSQATWKRRSAT